MKSDKVLLILLSVIWSALAQQHECGKIDELHQIEAIIHSGAVRGERLRVSEISTEYFHVFRGIPYAMPPVGSLRFQVHN